MVGAAAIERYHPKGVLLFGGKVCVAWYCEDATPLPGICAGGPLWYYLQASRGPPFIPRAAPCSTRRCNLDKGCIADRDGCNSDLRGATRRFFGTMRNWDTQLHAELGILPYWSFPRLAMLTPVRPALNRLAEDCGDAIRQHIAPAFRML
jgi:hypothetical protein